MDRMLEEIVISATVQSSATIAEALTLGFENCTAEECPLTFNQQMHIQQAALFIFREYEEKLRQHTKMIAAIHAATHEVVDAMIDGDMDVEDLMNMSEEDIARSIKDAMDKEKDQ